MEGPPVLHADCIQIIITIAQPEEGDTYVPLLVQYYRRTQIESGLQFHLACALESL